MDKRGGDRLSAEVLTTLATHAAEAVNRASTAVLQAVDNNAVRTLCLGTTSDLSLPRATSTGRVSIWGGNTVGLGDAVWANAVRVHASELEDFDLATATHPGVVVWPAVIGTAQQEHLSGEAVLKAGYAGIGLVVSAAVHLSDRTPSLPIRRTGWAGAVGAAGAVAMLLELGEERVAHAMAIAASCCGGVLQPNVEGSGDLFIQAGQASALGVRSAYLASQGWLGALAAIDGAAGWAGFFDGDGSDVQRMPPFVEIVDRLGYKRWPVGSLLQPLATMLDSISVVGSDVSRVAITAPTEFLSYPGLSNPPPFRRLAQAHTSILGVTGAFLSAPDRPVALDDLAAFNSSDALSITNRTRLSGGKCWRLQIFGLNGELVSRDISQPLIQSHWDDLPPTVTRHAKAVSLLEALGPEVDGQPRLARLPDWSALE